MAKQTGKTIAGVLYAGSLWLSGLNASGLNASGLNASGLGAGSSRIVLGGTLLHRMAIGFALVGVLISADVSADKPGIRSHYRTASNGNDQSSENDATSDHNAGPGMFGIRSFLRSRGKSEPRNELLSALPMERLTPEAKSKLSSITADPTLYRRLPTQAIHCDEELFLFLTRKPEAIIGIWDLMGITKVQANRVGPYELNATDGSGTTCQIDLIYGDRNLHVFMADGGYDGKFTQKPIRGRGVFVFKSTYAQAADGSTTVTGTLDSYIKFESLGADFLARSLGGLIGKSADHNFIETAKFISQISQACETNPDGMLEMVDRMPQVGVQTKREFARVITNVSNRYFASRTPSAKLVRDRGITETTR